MHSEKKIKSVSYAKWGYIFILPFFLTYLLLSKFIAEGVTLGGVKE